MAYVGANSFYFAALHSLRESSAAILQAILWGFNKSQQYEIISRMAPV